jgi:amidase
MDAIYASSLNLPYNQSHSDIPRMTTEQVDSWLEYRENYKKIIAEWMDQYDVGAVVYPGFISDMYNNGGSAAQSSSDRGTGVLNF